MKLCPYTRLDCEHPHLICKACPVHAGAQDANNESLVRARYIEFPSWYPYIKIVQRDDPTIEVGIKGIF